MIASLDHSSLKEFLGLYQHIQLTGDQETAKKLQRRIQKAAENEWHIALCGHFSAGKSSLINALIGQTLLPSSPIPTSANLVEVKKGDASAVVSTMAGATYALPIPFTASDLRPLLTNGDDVESVELRHPDVRLESGCTLLDTPGVDSVDEAHQRATEEGMYLADMVVYCMDCNHVQSDVNVQFLQSIKALGKPIVLVVTQMDKLLDTEIEIEQFRRDTETAFKQYDIPTEHLFFISVQAPGLKKNEWADLQAFLHTHQHNRGETDQHAARMLVDEHIEWLRMQQEEDRQLNEHIIADADENDIQAATESLQLFSDEIQQAEAKRDAFIKAARQDIEQTAYNAPLFSFDVREQVRVYLEAMEANFKPGLFSTKKKVETIRQERLTQLNESLQNGLEHLLGNLQNTLQTHFQSVEVTSPNVQAAVFQTTLPYQPKDLHSLIQPGATANPDYVLKYRDDVMSHIRHLAKQAFFPLIDAGAEALTTQIEEKKRAQADDVSRWGALVDAANKLETLDQKLAEAKAALLSELEAPTPVKHSLLEQLLAPKQPEPLPDFSTQMEDELHTTEENEPLYSMATNDVNKEQLLSDLYRAAQCLTSVTNLEQSRLRLLEKAKRIENKRFTVALFGAFSAGKSSFANALLGGSYLPVSPQPTTAAVNRIYPIDETHPDRHATIHMKQGDDLLDDVNHALAPTGKQVTQLDDIELLRSTLSWPENAGANQAFFNAFLKGWATQKSHIGTAFTVGPDQYEAYIADEALACYVDSIDVHIDSPLTSEGIALVDTPGADSINSRHTSVAFDYIKNADAILFVTYYNHAFSRADREFLDQLGKVKDAFALDKMFFIINAKDLAANADELNDVETYVQQQLAERHIFRPKLFSVSSRQALHNETKVQSGLADFQTAFQQFVQHELSAVVANEAIQELHFLDHVIKEALENAQLSEEKRTEKITVIEAQAKQLTASMNEKNAEPQLDAIQNETAQLLYHVRQRTMLNATSWFKQAFHPGLFYGTSYQEGIAEGVKEFLQMINTALVQEFRATALRLEQKATVLIQDMYRSWETPLADAFHTTLPHYEPEKKAVPDPIADIQVEQTVIRQLQKQIKSSRHFIEGSGRTDAQSTLFAIVEELLEQWSQNATDVYQPWNIALVNTQLADAKRLAIEVTTQTAETHTASLSPISQSDWQDAHEGIQAIVKHY
ncbi:dynamin family protein [Aureibacillus halotolerans]|uniref:Dynamin family protein n=1 Tax=Aureibacillus halotolerans TaxID=1508390 RepID=A0A4V3D667_9BACI|nr:dynamin family protein [Aureibacillus halotolerans]TDQ42787.1 dynamin family protein [Aureibacillus halotolerans]